MSTQVNLRDFHGPNQTILHTEFYRQRAQVCPNLLNTASFISYARHPNLNSQVRGLDAFVRYSTFITQSLRQPGAIVVGADSHTCSAGGVGAWAAGLGAADVVMPMVTGETWLKVPETCKVYIYIFIDILVRSIII